MVNLSLVNSQVGENNSQFSLLDRPRQAGDKSHKPIHFGNLVIKKASNASAFGEQQLKEESISSCNSQSVDEAAKSSKYPS